MSQTCKQRPTMEITLQVLLWSGGRCKQMVGVNKLNTLN